MAELVKAEEAMQVAARALDVYQEPAGEVTESMQQDAHAVYGAAAQIFAAARIAEAQGIQPYDYVYTPSYLLERFGS